MRCGKFSTRTWPGGLPCFYDENSADEYLAWINDRQEQKRG